MTWQCSDALRNLVQCTTCLNRKNNCTNPRFHKNPVDLFVSGITGSMSGRMVDTEVE